MMLVDDVFKVAVEFFLPTEPAVAAQKRANSAMPRTSASASITALGALAFASMINPLVRPDGAHVSAPRIVACAVTPVSVPSVPLSDPTEMDLIPSGLTHHEMALASLMLPKGDFVELDD